MEYSDAGDNELADSTYLSDPELAIPRPLQIVKRVDRLHDLGSRDASNSSGYSTSTDQSRGSVPARPEDSFPLLIPKKRQVARLVALASPTRQTEYQSPLREDKPHSPDADEETTPKPRRSTSCESPGRAVPDYLTRPPALSTKASLLFLKGKRPDISPLDGWKLSSSAASSRLSSSNFDISEHGQDAESSGTYLLAPKITVTSESKALDEGITTL
jgi:hypothetical protein